VSLLRRILLVAFVVGLGSSVTLSQSALLVLALLWVWELRVPAARARQRWPLLGPLLAFAAATLLSAALSGAPAESLLASKGLLLAGALWVMADAAAGEEEARRLLGWLTLAVTAAACLGLIQALACPGEPSSPGFWRWLFHRCDRARGAFSIYMTLAGVLTLVLLATLPRLLLSRRPGRLVWPWLLMLAALAATYTRGAWLGLAAGVLVVAAVLRRARVLLAAVLVVVAAAALLAPGPLGHRIRSMGDPEEAGIKERVYMWRSGLRMWAERPWLGVGPGGVKRRYAEFVLPEAFKKRTGHVHNAALQVLVERGVAGFTAWLWLWAAFFVRVGGMLRALPLEATGPRGLLAGSLAAVGGFLVAGLAEYNIGDAEVVLVLWSLMALPWAATRAGGPGTARPSAA
jgi:O-antigen ligase